MIKPGKYLYIGTIVPNEHAEEVKVRYIAMGYQIEDEKVDGEFTTIKACKPWSHRKEHLQSSEQKST